MSFTFASFIFKLNDLLQKEFTDWIALEGATVVHHLMKKRGLVYGYITHACAQTHTHI